MLSKLIFLVATAFADAGPSYALDDLLARVETGNLDIAVAEERLQQARNSVDKTWAALLPVAQAYGSYTRNNVQATLAVPTSYKPIEVPPPIGDGSTVMLPGTIGDWILQPVNQWVGGGKVTMPILVMPAYFGLMSAKEGVHAAENMRAHALGEIRFGVAQAYFGAVSSQQLIDLAHTQLDATKEQETVAQARFTAGQVPKIAFLRAGVDRARAEQDLRRAENGYAMAKLALTTLVGVQEPFSLALPIDPPPGGPDRDAAALVQAALQQRQDLQANNAFVEIAERSVTAQWWKFAPMLQASGEYRAMNFTGFTGKRYMWLAQLAAVFTIYDGALIADLNDAQSKAREASLRRDNVQRQVVQEVKTALLELESAQANSRKASEQHKLAEESAHLVKTNFDAGVASYLDVVDASSARFGAGVADVTEGLNVRTAALKLQKVIGELSRPR